MELKINKIIFIIFLFFKIINLNYEINFKIKNIYCNYSFENFMIFILLLKKNSLIRKYLF